MHKKRAFTLIELLVVIAIIALLMSILIPALSAAKKQAQGAACLGNQRGLITAYLAYAHDNDDQLVCGNTFDPSSTWNPPPPGELPWALPPLDDAGKAVGGNVSLEQRFRGIMKGALFPYTKDVKLYHCPGDSRVRQGTVLGTSLTYKIYRTYEIQGGLNGEELKLSGYTVKALSKIKLPGTTYVFIEGYFDGRSGQNYNAGSWVLCGSPQHGGNISWWNVPAIWHLDSFTMAYADGHASKWKCKDKLTIEQVKNRLDATAVQPNNPDLQYLCRNYAVRLPRP